MPSLLLTVAEFREQITTDIDGLVLSLRRITGRGGSAEEHAWRHSLPGVAKALASPNLANLHLYFGGKGNIALEYNLPSAPSWCDVVLLGAHNGRPSAVILELKDWQTRTDKPGQFEGLMLRQGRKELHPSDQVKGYTEYCRRFHSVVLSYQAAVHGCVLFTRDYFCQTYYDSPNDALSRDYPLFTLSPHDLAESIPSFLSNRLTAPDPSFAREFARGVYQQDRSFVRSVAAQLADPGSSPLELLDGQRRALYLCRENLESSIFQDRGPRKTVMVVEGPPGSGKSVVAARLWSNLVMDERLPDGNVTFVTTSTAQTSNWRALFKDATSEVAARGLVVTANEYMPFTTQNIGQVRRKHPNELLEVDRWRDNYRLLRQLTPKNQRTSDDHFLVSVVDEAHALINPEHNDARGQFGFAVNVGPQAYHIIRSSVVSIFFLDPQQNFRERESTLVADLKKWSAELGAKFIGPISLADAQFRCGGSKEYVDWVESLCEIRAKPLPTAIKEYRTQYGVPIERPNFQLRFFNTPFDLEEALRDKIWDGKTARLVASYARDWVTRDTVNPHELPDNLKDFHISGPAMGTDKDWSKIWNYVPNNGRDYTSFIRAPIGTRMHDDVLAEVGCPYVVRGFDFDYIGLLWLGDLKRRSGRWIVDLDQVFETGLTRHKQRARKERDPTGPDHQALIVKLLQGYRILLTRAMQGLYIWFEDTETQDYVEEYYNDIFGLSGSISESLAK